MLETIDLTREVPKQDYKAVKGGLDLKLAALQRQAVEQKVPVIVVFEGWDAAGKGTLINGLTLPLDPRGFNVHSTLPSTDEAAWYPFLRQFWIRTPARGRMAFFDRSWYRRVLSDRVNGLVSGRTLQQAYGDICGFERQLTEDGAVIIKFLLHISRQEQKKRFKKLKKNPATSWRVTEADLKRHKQYGKYLSAMEDMLAATDSEFAPWTVVEAHDRRFAELKIFNTVIAGLEKRLAPGLDSKARPKPAPAAKPAGRKSCEPFNVSILDRVDPSLALAEDEYSERLKERQKRLRELEHEIYSRRVPVVIAYEGWDAAGKGGNIRRLVQELDPRGYEVVPIAAPNDVEKAHHYLWRFWKQLPKAGHITIFDRTWYGRVLVERIEGFCAECEWKRAYREINEMEQNLTNYGTVLLKFWLHIDRAEQLRRFKERERLSHKQWKITEEDWRNREKWPRYKLAVDEMIFRTSTPYAPWTIVESNCKRHARVKVLDTVVRAIEKRLKA